MTGLAALAVIVLTGGLLAVRAGSGGRSNDIKLYQGSAVIGGQNVALSSLIGKGRPVVVNFWASNCPPCRMEMPGFQRVYDEHDGQGYVMLGIDVGPQTGLGTHEGARALLRQEAISYPVAYAEGDGLVLEYGLRGMPTTLFFDASGEQVARVVGFLPEAQLRARLAGLLTSR
ncbi:MAG TPA: TlpA disulfide reductase family protein [Trueperaceae bacterium]|nr:TlpA disulfide reductase family protein [Trueperaceae bacterium]